jgi:hypothetical protein
MRRHCGLKHSFFIETELVRAQSGVVSRKTQTLIRRFWKKTGLIRSRCEISGLSVFDFSAFRHYPAGMKSEGEVVEVEVVEIDGVAVEAKPEKDVGTEQRGRRGVWGNWQGQVRRLDRRWMPLWIALGVVFGVVILVVGVLIALVVIVFLMLRAILRAVFSLFAPPNGGLRGP